MAVFSVPGLVLLAVWAVRLVQWKLAAGGEPERVEVTPCLARAPGPGGGRLGPVTQSLWMVVGVGADRRYQRVVWQPWLSEHVGTFSAELRTGPARVAVLDVPGRGRLWPTSRLLDRPPWAVELTEFARATSPRTRADAWYRIAFVLVLLLFPCVYIGSLWGLAYLAAFAFSVWLWCGMVPPGWVPATSPPGGAAGEN
jgi:hypothetical protein